MTDEALTSDEPRPRRSDATRTSILAAARRRFAAHGYASATIRSIAADADIDPSMVMRYYGSKAGLFEAASAVALQPPRLSQVAIDDVGRAYADGFLQRWETRDNHVEEALLRSGTTQRDAVAQIQRIFDEQIVPAIAAAIPDDPNIRERAALIMSQSLGIVYCRYILGIEPLASMSIEDLAAAAGAAIQLHLTADAPIAGHP